MKKIPLITIVIIISLLLITSGCQAGLKKEKGEGVETFRTGSEGVKLSFVQNLPPAKLYDNEKFTVMLEVYNKGAYNTAGVGDRVYLSGFDPSIVTGVSSRGETIKLEGKDQFNLEGGRTTATFEGVIRRLDPDRYPFTLLATACYGYETKASNNICIDPDPYSPTAKQKVCVPSNVGFGTQAAPIAVSKVDVEARPKKTGFKIYISNVGSGDVFRYGGNYLTKCSPYDPKGLEYDETDYVQLVDVSVAGVSIRSTCKPLDDSHIRLTNKQGIVYCELTNIKSTPAFVSPLTVVLRYGYRIYTTKNVEVIRTG